jgi:molybdopterin converting factor small subunit
MHSLIFYGKLKNLCPETVLLPSQNSVEDLRKSLVDHFPQLHGEPFLLADEKGMLHDSDSLDGDESISIMPPFSGG